jgi:hypothetical protein
LDLESSSSKPLAAKAVHRRTLGSAGECDDSASAGERVTLDEAIALALDVNRLATKPERRQFVREGVTLAYDAVLRAQHALEIREEALRMRRELDRPHGRAGRAR